MNKIKDVDEAVEYIKDGMTLMVGGFMTVGTPEILIDGILKKGVKDLTIIANDTGYSDKGIGKLVTNKRVKKVIASHIGLNPETGRQMNAKELIVELVPQGTLAEQIRCGGAGIGGFLTETGVGTIVEEGKEKLRVGGKEYLLELPLRADVAIIGGSIVDKDGNVFYNASTRNFNPLIATAADLVIAGAEKIVEVGELDPSHVMTPGIFVDYIVGGER
ncbi:acetate CoA-transferase subunit alpha [Clostridium magnum]|uniref:Acetate CoA-transferase subunit alpha n=1 Tax=Clostridium magnum DSM 2767 TaxID=1121326 RepID=A0A162R014_9CLOT|nr:acetate CoA-transferase subunit alpha [Clostridium magnum]KZL89217.1 acetate CoA-transferase subunit alpha [Clostridium magnum DSM 2767]SHJ36547.1 acetate CoA/acetoacetate CoA-transferase alpha subunit [Clostridium magnum DSM 2767]